MLNSLKTKEMRKGRLLITPKNLLKPGELCFDTLDKRCILIVKIDDNGILTEEASTRTARPAISHVGLPADRFVALSIEDEVTDEVFPLDPLQQSYIFRSENRDRVLFFTCRAGGKEIAVVLSKDVNMQHTMNKMAPVADAYGEYVAVQKSMKEPAKRFADWFHSVSV